MRETSIPARSLEPGDMHAELSLTSCAEDPADMAPSGMCGAQPGKPNVVPIAR